MSRPVVVWATGLLVAVGLLAAGCGGSEPLTGPALSGEKLFSETVLAGNAGCITCHSLTPDKDLVGPSMAGVGVRAASRQPGVAARDYLRKSITSPDAFLVPGFEDKMLDNWAEVLSDGEIDALVTYLETLK